MVQVRKMTVDDMPSLKLTEPSRLEMYRPYLEKGSPAFIVEDEGKPLCAFGCILWWEGVADAWFNLISREKTISQIRIVKRVIAEQIKVLNLRRIQASARCSSLCSNRFLEKLGFQLEGTMRKYFPDGDDANGWSMIIKESGNG